MADNDQVRTFDINQVKVIVDGSPISGWGEGDVITWEPNGERYVKSVGSGGAVQRARVNDRSGQLTFIVQYGSSANDVFQRLLERDDKDNSGIGSISIEDLRGGFRLDVEKAWVMQDPGIALGDGNPEREWVFETGPVRIKHGSISI